MERNNQVWQVDRHVQENVTWRLTGLASFLILLHYSFLFSRKYQFDLITEKLFDRKNIAELEVYDHWNVYDSAHRCSKTAKERRLMIYQFQFEVNRWFFSSERYDQWVFCAFVDVVAYFYSIKRKMNDFAFFYQFSFQLHRIYVYRSEKTVVCSQVNQDVRKLNSGS